MNSYFRKRLNGIDFARCLALLGMLLVNYRLAMANMDSNELDWLSALVTILEGKAAALFVILAGIGLTLSTRKMSWLDAQKKIFWRAIFLFIIGLLNSTIFPADIIHYYAVYFVLGALCLRLPTLLLCFFILLCSLIPIYLIYHFDYNTSWNWQTLTYQDFWTLKGFMRNLWFNGFHPIFPWLAFLLLGIYLGRLNLAEKKTQYFLFLIGLSVALFSKLLSYGFTLYWHDANWLWLLSSSPIPPTPFYVLTASGIAVAVIGFCLLLYQYCPNFKLMNYLLPAGRQTLTLYMMHIIIGMGLLEYLGMLGGQNTLDAVLFALFYFFCAVVYANVWSKYFQYGLLEGIMMIFLGKIHMNKKN